jgi:hypothetical protein
MAVEKISYKTLVDEMTGSDTTNGWDVVVAYDENQINKLLASKKDAGLVAISPFTVPFYNPNTGEDEEVPYTLSLTDPSLKFDKSNMAVLTYDLSGHFGAAKRQVPDKIRVILSASIANLDGTVTDDGGESHFEPKKESLHPDAARAQTQKPNYVSEIS